MERFAAYGKNGYLYVKKCAEVCGEYSSQPNKCKYRGMLGNSLSKI